MARIICIALGSYGDVYPFLALAKIARSRGHEVTLALAHHFVPLAEKEGIPYIALGEEGEYEEAIKLEEAWDPIKGFLVVAREMMIPSIEPLHQRLVAEQKKFEAEHPGEKLALIAPATAFGARIAQETHGLRLATVHLQPIIIRTVHEAQELPGMPIPGRLLPKWARRLLFAIGDATMINPALQGPLNEYRAQFDLAPIKSPFKMWCHSPELVLALWPEWFGPAQPDWPQNSHHVGFMPYDEPKTDSAENDKRGVALDPDLLAWMEAEGEGGRPIVATPGSAMIFGRKFFEAVIDAASAVNRRALLLTRYTDHLPHPLPEHVRHCPYAPMEALLQHAGALVFHGGIGTLAQGLKAGIPLVVTPFAHDQFDNGARIERLGCGEMIGAKRLNERKLAAALKRLLGSAETTQSCAAIATKIDAEAATAKAGDLLDSWLNSDPLQ